jgi:uncharacterized peroxidase-related enzyme
MSGTTRISAIDPATTSGKAKDLLDAVKSKLGMVPNMMRTMAHSPAALDGYLAFSGALSHGVLDAKAREQIALAVGQSNSCDYCVAAHTAIGKMVGLNADEITGARSNRSADDKRAAILTLASRINQTRGNVTDADINAARSAGVTDAEIAETVANVALNIYTNYFNHIAATQIDFPKAPALA